MQKVQVTDVSDLSGEPADETVKFSLDGTEYEIDVTGEEAENMRIAFSPWIGYARKRPGSHPRGRSRRNTRSDLPDIRAYAQARGHDIKERGRIPKQIIDEYDLLKELKVIQ